MSEFALIQEMLKLKKWAVVGATDNSEKFGFKIYKSLKKAGYEVYPVNPGLTEVMGDKCYSSLTDLPVVPDAVDFVISSKIGEKIVAECAVLGIKNVWLQPGANGDNVVKAAQQAELNVVHQSCVMVEIRKMAE